MTDSCTSHKYKLKSDRTFVKDFQDPLYANSPTYDMTLKLESPKLRELSRAELQSLAKREVIRAVGKTEDIIRRLIDKHPQGVPVPESPSPAPRASESPSASPAPPKRHFFKKARKNTPSNSQVPDPSQAHPDPKGKGKAVASPSPSSSEEALGLLDPEAEDEAEDARDTAPPPEASNQDQPVEEEELDETSNYVKGVPSHYMVVDALRQFTSLANKIPTMQTHIAEKRCLLRRTEKLLEEATPVARELAVTREYLETVLLARMKQKRELWDGTGNMEKTARKARMVFLRAERRMEAEKKWAEVNEYNRINGHNPEPLSTFLLESDEDIIESLQTTPASSRGESSKRAREESADLVESDGGSGIGESPKKRARQ